MDAKPSVLFQDNPYSSPLNVGNVNYISGCPLFAKCDPRFQYDASARLKMIHRKATTGKKVFRKLQQTISCLANSFSSSVAIPGAVIGIATKVAHSCYIHWGRLNWNCMPKMTHPKAATGIKELLELKQKISATYINLLSNLEAFEVQLRMSGFSEVF